MFYHSLITDENCDEKFWLLISKGNENRMKKIKIK
jgi:hypothetical protein